MLLFVLSGAQNYRSSSPCTWYILPPFVAIKFNCLIAELENSMLVWKELIVKAI
jgi:hypothetical protein